MPTEYLKQRAELLHELRAFFTERSFTEVQTPVASHEVIPERHIELLRTTDGRYLQASPEMAMKQLLCEGSGSIFQIGPAFRAEEVGPLHAPEFTMVEWYRPRDDMQAGMDLLDELVQATLGTPACKRTSYRAAFSEHAGFDPLKDGRDGEQLNETLSFVVEPKLGIDRPELLYHYPASQSALATTSLDEFGSAVAERFEVYFRGVELANGYHELTNAQELRDRLQTANQQRVADGREALPMPEALLVLMESRGLPPCAGVALGFDRLLMLAVGGESIAEVMYGPLCGP